MLNIELRTRAPEAQLLADGWRMKSNKFWPHSALQEQMALAGSPSGSGRMNTTTHSHKTWTDQGGHIRDLDMLSMNIVTKA